MKLVSVVIPHFEDAGRLRRCLDALAEMPADDLDAAEVVVVDNASQVDLSWVGQNYPFASLVVEQARGAAAARNRGVAETSAPRIAFLDCDCVPEAGWLRCVLDLQFGPAGDVVGGRISTFDETPPPRSGSEAFETVFAFNQKSYVEKKGFSVTANLVTSRDLFDRVGEFRGGLSEDVDWCRRALAAGGRLRYDPKLAVAHPTRSDWPALRRKWVRTTSEAYGTEGASRRAIWLLKALAMPVSAIAHTTRILRSPLLDGAGERLRGVFTLFRIRFARMWWMILLAAGWNIRI
jgi:GT2 family glycosyltransferase